MTKNDDQIQAAMKYNPRWREDCGIRMKKSPNITDDEIRDRLRRAYDAILDCDKKLPTTNTNIRIYALVDPRTDETRYIGQTRNELDVRLMQHKSEKKNKAKRRWVLELRKLGLEPKIILLEEVDEREANEKEREYVKQSTSPLLNLAPRPPNKPFVPTDQP